jgi:hypothetical protein
MNGSSLPVVASKAVSAVVDFTAGGGGRSLRRKSRLPNSTEVVDDAVVEAARKPGTARPVLTSIRARWLAGAPFNVVKAPAGEHVPGWAPPEVLDLAVEVRDHGRADLPGRLVEDEDVGTAEHGGGVAGADLGEVATHDHRVAHLGEGPESPVGTRYGSAASGTFTDNHVVSPE